MPNEKWFKTVSKVIYQLILEDARKREELVLRRVGVVKAGLEVVGEGPAAYLLWFHLVQLAKMLNHDVGQLVKVEQFDLVNCASIIRIFWIDPEQVGKRDPAYPFGVWGMREHERLGIHPEVDEQLLEKHLNQVWL